MPTVYYKSLLLMALCLLLPWQAKGQPVYDLVLLHGRVMDPETGLDAVRNIGIQADTVAAITPDEIDGHLRIDATGLVVAPGFIDLHVHDMHEEHHRAQAMDGVTTALDLELGTAEVNGWYAARAGKTLVNYGVSIGHVPVRMAVMGDPGTFVPVGPAAHRAATLDEVARMQLRLVQGLEQGAVAVGFGINYTAAASHWEVLEMFRAVAPSGASCHVHLRYGGLLEPMNSVRALEEVLAATTLTGAPLHLVHVTSTGLGDTPRLLQMVREARARGLDVTTEAYPYTAGMTDIASTIFDEGWQDRLGIGYADLQWAATGERLTAERFAQYRQTGGLVAVHSMPEPVVAQALADPLTLIASDGLLQNGKGHPRAAGTYARILGRYVREQRLLTLMQALEKMTLLPARRLEHRVPALKRKGRIQVGADADLTVFDPEQVRDQSTYEAPGTYATGIRHVLVNGVLVVRDGQLQPGVAPGRPVRAPSR
jgi:N-acyl-D-aspartate/D-glutamate deacylase